MTTRQTILVYTCFMVIGLTYSFGVMFAVAETVEHFSR